MVTQKEINEYYEVEEQGVVLRDCYAIPIPMIRDTLSRLLYASHERVMFGMLALTGARISELDVMKRSGFAGNRFHWHLGKNQTGQRHVDLPGWYLNELKAYWDSHRFKGNEVFSKQANSFQRDFNKRLRDTLHPEWKQVAYRFEKRGIMDSHKLQLKGLRKTFTTFVFAQYYNRLKDATAALHFTSRDMRHSTVHMTSLNYLETYKSSDINQYLNMSLAEAICPDIQMRLVKPEIEIVL